MRSFRQAAAARVGGLYWTEATLDDSPPFNVPVRVNRIGDCRVEVEVLSSDGAIIWIPRESLWEEVS